jgi:CheY-like chemotaxis protein
MQIEEDDQKVHAFELTPGNYARLEVSDTGEGMSKKILANIFEPYFTTKEKGKGTGLGLAVVHGLVKSFAGHVSVYSEENRGTRFCVYLPISETDPADESTGVTALCPVGSEKILIVDDENVIVSMEKQMLECLGYQVSAFSSAAEAWQAFLDTPHQFDLVITDMTMPVMNGLDFARKIKATRPDIPIILCTGFSVLINHDKAKGLGICKYLSKPASKHDLAKAVREALDISRSCLTRC